MAGMQVLQEQKPARGACPFLWAQRKGRKKRFPGCRPRRSPARFAALRGRAHGTSLCRSPGLAIHGL